MNCTPTPSITLVQLAQMEQDYRDIISGNKARVIVDQNGERVEFTSANIARLYQYIVEQKALLNPCAGRARPNRPMGFVF